jgi:hypothetical protein
VEEVNRTNETTACTIKWRLEHGGKEDYSVRYKLPEVVKRVW